MDGQERAGPHPSLYSLELIFTDSSVYHADIKYLLYEEGHTYLYIQTQLLGSK